jgi:hypothetical protein
MLDAGWKRASPPSLGIQTAGEMNGFLKPNRPLVSNPLPVERGQIRVPPGYRPALDEAAIAAQTVAQAS